MENESILGTCEANCSYQSDKASDPVLEGGELYKS